MRPRVGGGWHESKERSTVKKRWDRDGVSSQPVAVAKIKTKKKVGLVETKKGFHDDTVNVTTKTAQLDSFQVQYKLWSAYKVFKLMWHVQETKSA